MPGILLSAEQSKAVETLLRGFLSALEAHEGLRLPPTLSVTLRVIYEAIKADDALEPHEFDVLVFLMDIYFEAVDDDIDIWPGLESAYARLKGHWPFDVSPHKRILYNPHLVGRYDLEPRTR